MEDYRAQASRAKLEVVPKMHLRLLTVNLWLKLKIAVARDGFTTYDVRLTGIKCQISNVLEFLTKWSKMFNSRLL